MFVLEVYTFFQDILFYFIIYFIIISLQAFQIIYRIVSESINEITALGVYKVNTNFDIKLRNTLAHVIIRYEFGTDCDKM